MAGDSWPLSLILLSDFYHGENKNLFTLVQTLILGMNLPSLFAVFTCNANTGLEEAPSKVFHF